MGKFFCKGDIPYYSPDGVQEYQIRTEMNEMAELVIGSDPGALLPGKYYFIGNVTAPIRVTLRSLDNSTAETYEGEFTLREGGSVEFPSQVKWSVDSPELEPGYAYHFEIKNGLGTRTKYSL